MFQALSSPKYFFSESVLINDATLKTPITEGLRGGDLGAHIFWWMTYLWNLAIPKIVLESWKAEHYGTIKIWDFIKFKP